jgi:predicted aldo/keto reductase-like oxidoreductase
MDDNSRHRSLKLFHRPFGKYDFKVSALDLGTMRLPTRSADTKDVDEELAIAMIRFAIDNGVNYVDSAYPYHGGSSEVVTGRALGQALIRACMLGLQMKGAQKICLWVDYANPHGARQQYYSEGYVDKYIEVSYRKDE